uniref:Solute carrier family 15 member 1 n=1 Tax=Plectus sambesii TaxID=2011161 RepID=A0A914XG34_9BILA
MNQDSCYPLAFGIPAILMIVATLIFLAGSFWYKKPPPKENIFAEVFRVMKQAIANKRFFDQKRDHWLDHYMDSHSCEHDEKCQALIRAGKRNSCHKREFVDDIKGLLRVAIMFLPVPMFWALYDQQGSRWLIQAVAMDCKLWGNALLLPDQMQTLNAVLILAFIPIFQVVVYPLVGKCVKLTALRKMVAGGLLACVAFVISAAVQLQVNTTLPDVPAKGQAFLSFANTFQNCNLTIAQSDSSFTPIHLAANSSLEDDKVKQIQQVLRLSSGKAYTWMISPTCYNGFTAPWNTLAYTSPALDSAKSFYVVVGNYGAYMTQAVWRKPTEGNGEFSLSINMATDVTTVTNLALCRREDNATNSNFPCDPGNDNNFYYWQLNYNDGTTDLGTDPEDDNLDNKTLSWTSPPNSPSPAVLNYINKPVRPGVWDLYYMPERAKDVDSKTPDRTKLPVNYTGISLEVEGQGGVFALIVTTDRSNNNMNAKSIYQIVPSNHISILWQIPQIAVLTAAEILFSITGYEFAYSQAAPSMKSLVQAMWLLTTAFGDTIIVIITLLNLFDNMAIELLFYAAIMLVVIIIFALISQFYYTYNDYTKGNDEDDDVSGVDNTGFEEEAVDEKPKY